MSPLGADQAQVLTELKNALRPLAGDALDNPPANASVEALAVAIFRVLTVDAVVSVSSADNAQLWTWLTDVGTVTGKGPPPVTSLTGKLT